MAFSTAALLASLLVLQPPAPAGRWVRFQDGAQASGYVDALSVERRGDIRRARERVDFHPAQDGMASVIGLVEVHCTRRTVQILAVETYDADGRRTSQSDAPGPTDPVEPGSNSDALLIMLCTGNGLAPETH